MKTALFVLWNDGIVEKHVYPTYEDAKQAENGYKMAFGDQVKYTSTSTWKEYTS